MARKDRNTLDELRASKPDRADFTMKSSQGWAPSLSEKGEKEFKELLAKEYGWTEKA